MRPYDVRNVGFLLTSKRLVQKHWCLQCLPLFYTILLFYHFSEMINLFCLPQGFESGRRRAGVRSFEPLRRLSEVDFAIHQTARLWAWCQRITYDMLAQGWSHVRFLVLLPGPFLQITLCTLVPFWRCETRLCLAKFSIFKTQQDKKGLIKLQHINNRTDTTLPDKSY